MTTARETIRQALRKAQKQVQSHAEPSEDPYARIADQEIDEALSLLDSHAVVPREPTDEMCVDGMEKSLLGRPSVDDSEYVESIYKAMVQAAQEKRDE